MTPEKKVENAIFTFLKSKGFFVFKVDKVGIFNAKAKSFMSNKNPNRIKGVADILGILPNGLFLAIEVKTDNTPWSKKTYPSIDQKKFLENVLKLGGVGFIARSVNDVEKVLKDLGYL